MIGHDALFVVNVDPDLVAFDFEGMLVGGEFFSLGAYLEAEMPVALARQFKVTPELGADFAVALVEFGQLLLERTKRLLLVAVGFGNGLFDDGRVSTKLADQLNDNFFQWSGGNAAQRAIGMLPVPVDASALVIEVLLALGVLFAAGVRNQAVATVAAMRQSFEHCLMLVAFANRRRLVEGFVQGFIGLFPKLGRYNAFMLAGIFLIAVPDDAFVKRIGDKLLDLVGTEALAADLLFGTARIIDTLARAGSLVVDLLRNHGGVAPFSGERVNAFDQHGLLFLETELFRLRVVIVTERDRSARPLAALGALGQFVADALGGQFALILPEAQQHVEHEPPGGCARIKAFRGGNKVRVMIFEQLPKLKEVAHGAGNAVEFVSHDNVNLAPLDRLNQSLNAGAFEVLARKAGVFKKVRFLPAFVLVDANGVSANIVLTL